MQQETWSPIKNGPGHHSARSSCMMHALSLSLSLCSSRSPIFHSRFQMINRYGTHGDGQEWPMAHACHELPRYLRNTSHGDPLLAKAFPKVKDPPRRRRHSDSPDTPDIRVTLTEATIIPKSLASLSVSLRSFEGNKMPQNAVKATSRPKHHQQ